MDNTNFANPGVLIVDDEPVNILALKQILMKSGFNVFTAENGPEARTIAAEKRPDLILLDVMMPVESGFDTLVKLKENPGTASIPVIFITCLDDINSKLDGLNLGALDYITKPFHATEVLARIHNHLNARRRDRDIINEQADKLGQVRQAQQAMLVKSSDLPEARFEVSFVPALEAGGDFYDVFNLDKGKTAYFVADVSGHDLGASFITSSLKVMVRQSSKADTPPEKTLESMNRILASVVREAQFLTAVYAVLDRERGEIEIAGAGHPPAILVPVQGAARMLRSRGEMLGIFKHVNIEGEVVGVQPGDRVFLYSDGLIDLYSEVAGSVKDGLTALTQALGDTRRLPLDKALDTVLGVDCPDCSKPVDDIVLLGFAV